VVIHTFRRTQGLQLRVERITEQVRVQLRETEEIGVALRGSTAVRRVVEDRFERHALALCVAVIKTKVVTPITGPTCTCTGGIRTGHLFRRDAKRRVSDARSTDDRSIDRDERCEVCESAIKYILVIDSVSGHRARPKARGRCTPCELVALNVDSVPSDTELRGTTH
jgi:hypothetical protein